MGAFIIAFLVLVIFTASAFFVGFAQGMATAPHYTNSPLWIFGAGVVFAILIALTHWGPHIGW